MPELKATPGPWYLYMRGSRTICADVKRDRQSFLERVAGARDTPEGQANARLIAAAPDLYEAVRLFVEEYDKAEQADGVALMLAYNTALEAGKAALAKARGDQ